jgi:uncharacterized alkaline shock family protein YloU
VSERASEPSTPSERASEPSTPSERASEPSTPSERASEPSRPRIRLGDAAVARIAAAVAAGVPGVVSLRPDLGQTLLGLATSLIGDAAPTSGATAAVTGDHAEVTVTVVTALGHNARDLCAEVQRAVARRLEMDAGLTATVTVTVADVLLT